LIKLQSIYVSRILEIKGEKKYLVVKTCLDVVAHEQSLLRSWSTISREWCWSCWPDYWHTYGILWQTL